MKCIEKRLRRICLPLAFVVVFLSGCLARHFYFACRTNQIKDAVHPARRTHLWPHEPTGVMVCSRPASTGAYLADLCLHRGEDIVVIPREPTASWHDFFVVSETNQVFVLVKVQSEFVGGYHSSELVKLVLPRPNESLDAYSLETIFTMDSLATKQGRSWISKIEGVTSDGRKLLLLRSFPLAVTSGHRDWVFREVVYNMGTRAFEYPQFETDRALLVSEKVDH